MLIEAGVRPEAGWMLSQEAPRLADQSRDALPEPRIDAGAQTGAALPAAPESESCAGETTSGASLLTASWTDTWPLAPPELIVIEPV